MKITFLPQRRDDTLTVIKQGDALTINNTEYDFSKLPDDGTLPKDAVDCEWIVSDINRVDGALELTLLLPHGADASEAARFPDPIVNPTDGQVELPQ